MESMIILVFIIGYLFITIENIISLNKVFSSLIMASVCWSLIMFFKIPVYDLNDKSTISLNINTKSLLLYHLGKTSEIVFFIVGAMLIISIIDRYSGFDALRNLFITDSITKRKFLWIISILSFFLSAIIDNLTSTMVIITILRKIISDYKERLYYIGLVIISANAGGVWSPIGDITTTMLWISNKVTTLNLLRKVFIPSILCLIISTLIGSFMPVFNGFLSIKKSELSRKDLQKAFFILNLGISLLLFVPIFKTITGLPPYMGMIFSLGILGIATTNFSEKNFSIDEIFKNLDLSSILFFFGILLSVSSLESLGILYNLSQWINNTVSSWKITAFLFGLISSIIDNVPLVAATIAMFSYPLDHDIWHFIAYVSGTGGSIFLIGSASGVAAMGMENIDFFWYFKKIGWIALIGYFSGFLYLLFYPFFFL
ncbi:sodium:proton antiporter NhaD [Blattabacterium cuenoti]|uniref:sodium:proton antiporter NhaD n=1 Tax=Blattabacterium cuenoti TaxID=1653831 RepID=UPI00163CA121|nr:sodium:proton antiporter NhaD [Blattabacterium cuenoti]